MNYYIGSMAFMDNDICHYGVKGMKWGVRRYEYDGAKGLRQRHAVRVASRLQQVNMDAKRKSHMNANQVESLKKATKYWDARAKGKKPASKRGFVRRWHDAYRSRSTKERAIYGGISAVSSTASQVMKGKMLGLSPNIASTAVSNMSASAISLGVDEVLNRLFGHF